jgi:hypothetical protein
MKNFVALLIFMIPMACSHQSTTVAQTPSEKMVLVAGRSPASTQDAELGDGSVIVQRQEIDFGKKRSKRYCDGKEAGLIKSFAAGRCCTLSFIERIHSSLSIYLSPQERVLNIQGDAVELSGKNLTKLRVDCGSPVTVSDFENVFGDIFEVKEVKPHSTEKNTNLEAEDSGSNITPVGI